jgi:hypothetical protein
MAMFPGCGGKTISQFQSAAIDIASQQQTASDDTGFARARLRAGLTAP